jgi:hypothetical protein
MQYKILVLTVDLSCESGEKQEKGGEQMRTLADSARKDNIPERENLACHFCMDNRLYIR